MFVVCVCVFVNVCLHVCVVSLYTDFELFPLPCGATAARPIHGGDGDGVPGSAGHEPGGVRGYAVLHALLVRAQGLRRDMHGLQCRACELRKLRPRAPACVRDRADADGGVPSCHRRPQRSREPVGVPAGAGGDGLAEAAGRCACACV